MNYRDQLLSEHSRANADLVLNHVLKDRKRVAKLMEVFLGEEYRSVQRSAMVVGNLGRLQPAWLQPWYGKMIAAAKDPQHDAVVRNVMRYFSEISLDQIGEEDQGELLELALRLTESQLQPVAIRVFSMTVAANFCQLYPELKDELRGIIELTIAEGATAGFRSRGNKLLKKL